jgi:UDP-N-acetylmuramyl tripeptide synthase
MLYISVPLGKLVRRVSRLRGGGSALPGLVVERIDPGFMQRTLATLPHGVAVVSGTNGKTTTTKMVVELLESQGLKVFTNRPARRGGLARKAQGRRRRPRAR